MVASSKKERDKEIADFMTLRAAHDVSLNIKNRIALFYSVDIPTK